MLVLSKHLFVTDKLSLIWFITFSFAQITIHDFQNTLWNSWWHCLRQMAQNSTTWTHMCFHYVENLEEKKSEINRHPFRLIKRSRNRFIIISLSFHSLMRTFVSCTLALKKSKLTLSRNRCNMQL